MIPGKIAREYSICTQLQRFAAGSIRNSGRWFAQPGVAREPQFSPEEVARTNYCERFDEGIGLVTARLSKSLSKAYRTQSGTRAAPNPHRARQGITCRQQLQSQRRGATVRISQFEQFLGCVPTGYGNVAGQISLPISMGVILLSGEGLEPGLVFSFRAACFRLGAAENSYFFA
jgi:hypothetical protein